MKRYIFALGACALLTLPSCVNEWPRPEDRMYTVTLLLHSNTDWLPNEDMTYTREDNLEISYQIQIYNAGKTTDPVKEMTLYSADLNRGDLSVNVDLNPGSYDVYVWSDICDATTGKSLFYDSSNFADITYLTPYRGDSNNKDAFRGQHNFTIDASIYKNPTATEVINLERPLARYIFVATDLDEFIENEQTRGKMRGLENFANTQLPEYTATLENVLQEYTVKIIYPMYMPSKFDNFTNKPFDSWTGISFEGDFVILNEKQAQIGLDYVMVNGNESSVQVAMEIYDSDGVRISSTSTINIPTLRDRTTIVYGRFLTADEDAGVSINPDFAGSFDIPYN